MLCFETDLQVVRTSPAGSKISLSASRWALAEAAIVADIGRRTWIVAMTLATARMMPQIFISATAQMMAQIILSYTTVKARKLEDRYSRP